MEADFVFLFFFFLLLFVSATGLFNFFIIIRNGLLAHHVASLRCDLYVPCHPAPFIKHTDPPPPHPPPPPPPVLPSPVPPFVVSYFLV